MTEQMLFMNADRYYSRENSGKGMEDPSEQEYKIKEMKKYGIPLKRMPAEPDEMTIGEMNVWDIFEGMCDEPKVEKPGKGSKGKGKQREDSDED
ncbi:hypothetical protein PHLCEN_2v3260, partial [Hermanssonia centrifuga]